MIRRAALVTAAVPALLLGAAGCGGGSDDGPAPRAPQAEQTPSPTPTATPAAPSARAPEGESDERRTIDRWAKAMARSDVDRAATFFALPVVVSQGSPLKLRTRAEVEFFNETLPCGAELVSSERDGRYVVGTFRLKDRPGKQCDGPGGTAKVAFAFRGGRFSEWRRVPAGEAPPADAETA